MPFSSQDAVQLAVLNFHAPGAACLRARKHSPALVFAFDTAAGTRHPFFPAHAAGFAVTGNIAPGLNSCGSIKEGPSK